MSLVYALALVLSLWGSLLIARRRSLGWVCWIIANLLWIILNLRAARLDPNLYWQALLFAAYACTAVYGWWSWCIKPLLTLDPLPKEPK